MTSPDDRVSTYSTLPELEDLLLRTARRRTRPRLRSRRWVLAIAAGSLILAGGVTAAATGVLHIATGQTSKGAFSIDSRLAPEHWDGPPGSICLQLQREGSEPAYGCGERPTPENPFGLVIADSGGVSRDRVIYGLVAGDVTRVRVLGRGGDHTDTATNEKDGLPGRFFSVVVPNRGRIELVAYDAAGRERARIGSRSRPTHRPRSRDDAVAQGDPAGFAPTVAAPSSFTYEGRRISPDEAARRKLSCAQRQDGVQCYDSLAELDAAQARQTSGR